jgi:predicted dinucleotide-binding enzyme
MMAAMDIAVIGSGNIGGTLARRWVDAGHRVTLGARDPATGKAQSLTEQLGVAVEVHAIGEAIEGADAVLVATPGAAVADLAAEHGDRLARRVVLDATNDMAGSSLHHMDEWAVRAPGALVFRAFNTLGWENFAEPDHDGDVADLFYCGPEAARTVVEELIGDIGLRPCWIGGADRADVLDGVTRLWFTLVLQQGRTRRTALKLLD